MNLDFGRGLPSDEPLTASVAVRRGHLFVTLPVFLIMFGLWALVFAVAPDGPMPRGILGIALMILIPVGPPVVAWIWWSYTVPRWRYWALSNGVNPEHLQMLAQSQKLVWPKGHFFEKTEFRYPGPQ